MRGGEVVAPDTSRRARSQRAATLVSVATTSPPRNAALAVGPCPLRESRDTYTSAMLGGGGVRASMGSTICAWTVTSEAAVGQMRSCPGLNVVEPTSSPGRCSGSSAAGFDKCNSSPRVVTAPAHRPMKRRDTSAPCSNATPVHSSPPGPTSWNGSRGRLDHVASGSAESILTRSSCDTAASNAAAG